MQLKARHIRMRLHQSQNVGRRRIFAFGPNDTGAAGQRQSRRFFWSLQNTTTSGDPEFETLAHPNVSNLKKSDRQGGKKEKTEDGPTNRMGQTDVTFQNQRSANPRRGASYRGWQGAGATLVAQVAATQANLF